MDFFGLFFVLLSLMKFISTSKMLIMMMSLEMCSVFIFFSLCFSSLLGSGISLSIYSLFLVFAVIEGVTVLVVMMNVYRGGSVMVKSLFSLKF